MFRNDPHEYSSPITSTLHNSDLADILVSGALEYQINSEDGNAMPAMTVTRLTPVQACLM